MALTTVTEQARSARFTLADLKGGTFTISNLGAIGGTYSTPIINMPDVAVLLLGRSRKLPVVVEGDKIVNRYIERGTLTGRSFLGVEPAGQRYEKPGTTVYRVADGRLAESWGVEDTLGWFRQLGKYTD